MVLMRSRLESYGTFGGHNRFTTKLLFGSNLFKDFRNRSTNSISAKGFGALVEFSSTTKDTKLHEEGFPSGLVLRAPLRSLPDGESLE
jgi:hypothetical protein